jgi:hypothetical protein
VDCVRLQLLSAQCQNHLKKVRESHPREPRAHTSYLRDMGRTGNFSQCTTKHKGSYIVNLKITLLGPSIAGAVALLAGCESSAPTQPVASYQTPYYQGAQPYRYPQQQISQGPATSPQGAPPPAAPPPNNVQAQAAADNAVRPETIPSSPGPDYVWMPSYWTIGVGGGWVWVGGHYVLRQGASEEQLRAARGMLEQARMDLSGSKAKSINKAIDQINDALQSR